MALKYKIDRIVEGNPHTVYVNLYDDAMPDVTLENLCLQYVTEADFESELQRKTEKYLASVAVVDTIEPSVTKVFASLEGKMETIKASAAVTAFNQEVIKT